MKSSTANKYVILVSIILLFFVYLIYIYFDTNNTEVGSLRALAPGVYPSFIESKLSCTQNSYDRGVGTIPLVRACPANTWDSGTDCFDTLQDYGPNFYLSGVGYPYYVSYGNGCSNICKEGENHVGPCICDRTGCNNGDDNIAGLCYPKCAPGWNRSGLGCHLPCSAGLQEIAGHCYAGSLNMLIPLSQRQYCPDGKEMQNNLCYTKCQQSPLFKGIANYCWADVATKPKESHTSPLIPVQVIPKQVFTRDALFEGTAAPPKAC